MHQGRDVAWRLMTSTHGENFHNRWSIRRPDRCHVKGAEINISVRSDMDTNSACIWLVWGSCYDWNQVWYICWCGKKMAGKIPKTHSDGMNCCWFNKESLVLIHYNSVRTFSFLFRTQFVCYAVEMLFDKFWRSLHIEMIHNQKLNNISS